MPATQNKSGRDVGGGETKAGGIGYKGVEACGLAAGR